MPSHERLNPLRAAKSVLVPPKVIYERVHDQESADYQKQFDGRHIDV